MSRLKVLGLLFATASLIVFAGCGDSKKETSTSSGASATQTTPSKAKVTFVMPTQGTHVIGDVYVGVSLDNFVLDKQAIGKANQDEFGHLYFSMDNGKYDYPKYTGASGPNKGVEGKYTLSGSPTLIYKGVPEGTHTLKVELVNNDGSPTGVSKSVTFTETKAG